MTPTQSQTRDTITGLSETERQATTEGNIIHQFIPVHIRTPELVVKVADFFNVPLDPLMRDELELD